MALRASSLWRLASTIKNELRHQQEVAVEAVVVDVDVVATTIRSTTGTAAVVAAEVAEGTVAGAATVATAVTVVAAVATIAEDAAKEVVAAVETAVVTVEGGAKVMADIEATLTAAVVASGEEDEGEATTVDVAAPATTITRLTISIPSTQTLRCKHHRLASLIACRCSTSRTFLLSREPTLLF